MIQLRVINFLFLNKKKKRKRNLNEAKESIKSYSDTNQTIQCKKNNKKRKDETRV